MNYSLTTITPPASEPVSLERAKVHLRIDHDEENELVKGWIGAARELCEAYTGKRFGSQSLRLVLREFPDGDVELPVEPVGAVTLFKYLDADGVEVTFAADEYQTWLDHSPPLLCPLPDEFWPDTERDRRKAVTVEFTAGAGETPEMVRTAILLTLGNWDENRGDQNALIARGLPPSAKAQLDLLWTGSYR